MHRAFVSAQYNTVQYNKYLLTSAQAYTLVLGMTLIATWKNQFNRYSESIHNVATYWDTGIPLTDTKTFGIFSQVKFHNYLYTLLCPTLNKPRNALLYELHTPQTYYATEAHDAIYGSQRHS